jgi:outer membrane protein TolC
MAKHSLNIGKHIRAAASLLLLCAFVTACASNKAGVKSPELPPRHWLEESPGVPVENKAKLDAAVPGLYDPNKVFTFEDCVFLAIQQSPLLVNSAVEIEVKRVALTDAKWHYLPEPRMTFQVSNNLTRYNTGMSQLTGNYEQTNFRVGFYAAFPNPVATYIEHNAQKLMVNLAIATHRKAVGEAVYKIAQAYLQLQTQQKILAAHKEILPIGKEVVNYWRQVETVDGRQGVSLNLAIQHERELNLNIEQAVMQETMERTRLKIIAGVDPQQRLNVDTKNADAILGDFDGQALAWEERWTTGEDELLLRGQIKLADYNIMVAWAQYIPNMNLQINQSPPAGQYNPPHGREDFFLHLNFDFPLLDWGHRYRGVQTARMEKAKAFHSIFQKRTEYSNEWLRAQQNMSLALTKLKLAKTRFTTTEMQYKESHIAFSEGTLQLPDMTARQEAMVTARIAVIEAELTYKLANLEWMYLANLLQERFLGLPAKELM